MHLAYNSLRSLYSANLWKCLHIFFPSSIDSFFSMREIRSSSSELTLDISWSYLFIDEVRKSMRLLTSELWWFSFSSRCFSAFFTWVSVGLCESLSLICVDIMLIRARNSSFRRKRASLFSNYSCLSFMPSISNRLINVWHSASSRLNSSLFI